MLEAEGDTGTVALLAPQRVPLTPEGEGESGRLEDLRGHTLRRRAQEVALLAVADLHLRQGRQVATDVRPLGLHSPRPQPPLQFVEQHQRPGVPRQASSRARRRGGPRVAG
jgi:hypothetical protein